MVKNPENQRMKGNDRRGVEEVNIPIRSLPHSISTFTAPAFRFSFNHSPKKPRPVYGQRGIFFLTLSFEKWKRNGCVNDSLVISKDR